MGKRSNFVRVEKDSYPTPRGAVYPLLGRLPPNTRFVEPCAGEGKLIGHLEAAGHICVGRYDLPDDARFQQYAELKQPDVLAITNPPWHRPVLHAIITNLSSQADTWILIDWDWLATKQAAPFLPRILDVVVIGRCKWIEGSPYTSKDSACWILFSRPSADGCVRLFGRPSVREAA
jgi:hypothetical protein